MLSNYLTRDVVDLNVNVQNAEEAIRYAGELLVKSNLIKPAYVDEMVDTYRNLGPYIVLAPHIAMPHSKPSDNVMKPCLSFCRLQQPIRFNHTENDPVHFVFALAGNDEFGHMALLQSLGKFLMDEENVKKLYTIHDFDGLIEILGKEDKV
ncbi:MAG: PTS sugar transporter subunit IIA [Anaerorhabdus sp.]|uniref:PTS sugar transporter subunit IIA n=1 Tax=Anaerorhabdus sp. TaxID=1872524 RepID=UPI003A8B9F3F